MVVEPWLLGLISFLFLSICRKQVGCETYTYIYPRRFSGIFYGIAGMKGVVEAKVPFEQRAGDE